MRRISTYAVCGCIAVSLFFFCAAQAFAFARDNGQGAVFKMAQSADPRAIEVEEDVWIAKNQEIQDLRDQLLKVTAALKITEAEKDRLARELSTVKKGIQGKDVKMHKVEQGENLWKIAQKYYKDPYKWLWLFKANIDQIEDPDNLFPEQVIDIPRY